MSDALKILVVPADPISAYREKGLDAALLQRYFEPAGVDARILNVRAEPSLQWPGFGVRFLDVPEDPALLAWIGAATHLGQRESLAAGTVDQGFPGPPPSWLDAISEFGPQIIRGYGGGWCGYFATVLAAKLGIKSIASVHDLRGIAPETLLQANAVLAVSDAVAERCILAGVAPASVVTVPDRVDRSVFAPDGPLPNHAPTGSPRLLCVSRDSAEKNLDRLLTACERVSKQYPQLLLVHAGTSARDWSRWPFVRHFEAIPNTELPRWYRWADWFVHPSLSEGFGIVLAEALACGTPCITSARAPMNETVRGGVCGLTCDPESVDSITATLERAVGEKDLRRKLAATARGASEGFDLARVEARETALYRTLIHARSPLVSVVLPTFNRSRLIEAAIRNVLAQDYKNLELIVVNDGSTDGTQAILERLSHELQDSRLRVLTKANAGLPRALNTGFEAAGGEYLTWTSDDNAYRHGAIGALVRELELDAGVGLVFADYQVVANDGSTGAVVVTGPIEELTRRNVIGACFMYRREIAAKVGTYNPEVELAEDYDYWMRMAAVTKLAHLPRLLYDYGDSADSLSRRKAIGVTQAAALVVSRRGSRDALRGYMVALAGQYKWHGMPFKSFATAIGLVFKYPFSKSGYWAAARALTPLALLRMTRHLRGLDGKA